MNTKKTKFWLFSTVAAVLLTFLLCKHVRHNIEALAMQQYADSLQKAYKVKK